MEVSKYLPAPFALLSGKELRYPIYWWQIPGGLDVVAKKNPHRETKAVVHSVSSHLPS